MPLRQQDGLPLNQGLSCETNTPSEARVHPDYALCLNSACKYDAAALSVCRLDGPFADSPTVAYCPSCDERLDRNHDRVEAWRQK